MEHVLLGLLSCSLMVVQPASSFPHPSLLLALKCQAISEYFDSVTGSCEPCREICELAHITRTQQECETQCGDYVLASKCTSDQYYDTVVHSCAPCSELCDSFHVTNTRDDCLRQCPGYTTMRLPSSNVSATPNGNSSAGEQDPPSQSDVGLTIAIIIIVLAVVVVGVTLTAVAAVVCRPGKCCWWTSQVIYTPVVEGSPASSITKPIPCAADEV
ncbi:hypothetical protein C0Q70_00099 [Pomacea canaliculata]|uniref:TNFR-Cys domain-containing protein n=2 Tax=Pomacea canaliculata TaxID=400727 RepID=A0A2T7PVP9_POMCA|nr:hypothetical protein C0Q70_00099 [Pomacea canaliculata]